MGLYKQTIQKSKKECFMDRARVLLATKGLLLSDKTLEVLYWVLYYKIDHPKLHPSNVDQFKNMNQMHVVIAKHMQVFSSYIGAYINDRIVPFKILKKVVSNPVDKFSKPRVLDYEIREWLEKMYKEKTFNININYVYE
jgi:hypothetical protein